MTSTYVIWLILTYHDVDISIWVDSHPTLHTSTGILMYNEEWWLSWLITIILQPSVEWLFFVSKRHDDDDVSPHQPLIPLRDNRWHRVGDTVEPFVSSIISLPVPLGVFIFFYFQTPGFVFGDHKVYHHKVYLCKSSIHNKWFHQGHLLWCLRSANRSPYKWRWLM